MQNSGFEIVAGFTPLLSDQGTFTPVGAQGGFHGTPLRKPFFHRNFAMKFAPYMYGQ